MGKDAHLFRFAFLFFALFLLTGGQYDAAQFETANFTVENAPTSELAKQFCETAERCRSELAVHWLGKELPHWSEKCRIHITVGEKLGAGGATTFVFENGEVYGWEMTIQGSALRLLDSVIPHEVTHTVFASHFRKPLPRWLDEGAATTVECDSEKENYRRLLLHFLKNDVKKCLPFNRMATLKDYPSDPLPLYAQGFSVTEFLIALGNQENGDGHRRLVRFAESGMKNGDWNAALYEHYRIENLGELQQDRWLAWVGQHKTQGKTLGNIQLVSATVAPSYTKSVYDKSDIPTAAPPVFNDAVRTVWR
jgi:hypothetical protein